MDGIFSGGSQSKNVSIQEGRVDPRVGLDARKRYVHKGWARIHLALSR
jgi:hypothetical protein